jgi:putative transposase
MPRRARIVLPGIPAHLVQRGNNRADCFLRDQDRAFYLHHLGRLLIEERCALHAYCLMTNHVHLLVTANEPHGYARLMQRVGQLYSQYINRTTGRTGTLWEGRFKSSPVQSESYLLSCYRYIELNPVRAGLVADPADYEWSSYRANGNGASNLLLTPHHEYERLGARTADRQRAYRALVAETLSDDTIRGIREAMSGNYALGDTAFVERIATSVGRRAGRGEPGRPRMQAPEPAGKRGLSLI